MAMNQSAIGGQLWKQGAQAPTVVGSRTFTPAAWYPSSSNAKKGYTVCEVNDGSVSCDCMGWTRRNPTGGRTCKHTQDYLSFLRPLWNSRGVPRARSVPAALAAEPVVQAANTEKGGTLSELFAKLEKGGLGD